MWETGMGNRERYMPNGEGEELTKSISGGQGKRNRIKRARGIMARTCTPVNVVILLQWRRPPDALVVDWVGCLLKSGP